MKERKTRIVSFSVAESSPKTHPVLENKVLKDPEGAGCVWNWEVKGGGFQASPWNVRPGTIDIQWSRTEVSVSQQLQSAVTYYG